MSQLKVADRWFERRKVSDDITLVWEPHVHPLLRCNIWHVRGRDRDLLIDTGLGVTPLRPAIADLIDKPLTTVATHIHYDHVGGLHEFDERIMHVEEAARMVDYQEFCPLLVSALPQDIIDDLAAIGYPIESDALLTAVPQPGYDLEAFGIISTAPTRQVVQGDTVDLGNRHFEVMHLPGHSPGSIGLWEATSGTLFSGDAVYDGPLIDQLPDSDIAAYIETMQRLRELPVSIVHGGHEPSFGRERLIELVDEYLALRG